MARERRTATGSPQRDSAVERERRERARRERERQRAAAPPPQRAARPARATADVAVRERHEGLVGWIVRSIATLPSTIASIPSLVVVMLRSFAIEVVSVVRGIGRALLAVLPGSVRVPSPGRRRTVSTGGDAAIAAASPRTRRGTRAPRTIAEQRASALRRARLRRRLRLASVVVLLVAVVAAWVVVPASDAFRIRHLEVTGASAVSDLEVRERIDSLLEGKTVFTVDEDKLVERIAELPFVRDVRVERHLPGGLQLHILEYRPLALGLGDGTYWLVAPDGRVLAKAHRDDWKGRIPTVTLRDGDIRAGDHVDDEPALQLLASRPSSSTLEFDEIETGEYTLDARLVGGIDVRFGRPIALRQKLLVAEKMIREAARKDLEPRYIDVTVPGKPAFCARSVVACGMRRGPAPTDATAAGRAGTAVNPDALADAVGAANVINGADELAADGA